MISILVAIAAAQVATVKPPVPATIEEALESIQSEDPACERSEYPDLRMTMYLCQHVVTVWYFTVPDEELPPGFVRRMLVRDGQAIKMMTDAAYFGADSQEHAFFQWQAELASALEQ